MQKLDDYTSAYRASSHQKIFISAGLLRAMREVVKCVPILPYQRVLTELFGGSGTQKVNIIFYYSKLEMSLEH